jgi:hypothetical protein
MYCSGKRRGHTRRYPKVPAAAQPLSSANSSANAARSRYATRCHDPASRRVGDGMDVVLEMRMLCPSLPENATECRVRCDGLSDNRRIFAPLCGNVWCLGRSHIPRPRNQCRGTCTTKKCREVCMRLFPSRTNFPTCKRLHVHSARGFTARRVATFCESRFAHVWVDSMLASMVCSPRQSNWCSDSCYGSNKYFT